MDTGPRRGCGVIVQIKWPSGAVDSSIRTPNPRSPATINSLSRLTNGLCNVVGELANEARINARLVTDLEPGISTVKFTGRFPRYGARHMCSVY